MRRRLALLLVLATVAMPTATVAALVPDPAQWPSGAGLDPDIDTTAHSIRFAGSDRYETNLAMSLALRGRGDHPFDTPDPTSGGAGGLAAADDWWGAATCPRSVLVVAGDTFADALAASSLSDPTDRSTQPRVERVAAADPVFDPVGGFDRVDTAAAPVIVTASARSGASSLSSAARLSLTDLAGGGCTLAREAIIVGGTGAVGRGVESELVSLGYDEVFRVAGADRYETAARVATALGTGVPPPAGSPCNDPLADDGDTRLGHYGNAVVEFRTGPQDCRLLPRSVVLADGGTGADALAAGWWTSRWQVPILLTAPDGSLPPATRAALQSLPIDSLIVLGGIGRIPEATVEQAKRLAGAVAGRIAGADRYSTSVAMAQRFGGWYPTGDGADFAGDLVCLAASSGSGDQARGWPDALAAGPFCARLGGADSPGSPERALAPFDGRAVVAGGGQRPAHDAVPVLLVPSGGHSIPSSVNRLLRDAFDRTTSWCHGRSSPGADCAQPGFAVTFGGTSAVTETTTTLAAMAVGGGRYTDATDRSPRLDEPFVTRLDMAPAFTVAPGDGRQACALPGGFRDVRWLVPSDSAGQHPAFDVLAAGAYESGGSAPSCVPVGEGLTWLAGVSGSGHRTLPRPLAPAAEGVTLSAPIEQQGDGADEGSGRTWTFRSGPDPARSLTIRGQVHPIRDRALDLDLASRVGPTSSVHGQFALDLEGGAVTGTIVGQAVVVGDAWEVRGRAEFGRPGEIRYRGGFRASVTGDTGAGTTRVTWSFDGVPE